MKLKEKQKNPYVKTREYVPAIATYIAREEGYAMLVEARKAGGRYVVLVTVEDNEKRTISKAARLYNTNPLEEVGEYVIDNMLKEIKRIVTGRDYQSKQVLIETIVKPNAANASGLEALTDEHGKQTPGENDDRYQVKRTNKMYVRQGPEPPIGPPSILARDSIPFKTFYNFLGAVGHEDQSGESKSVRHDKETRVIRFNPPIKAGALAFGVQGYQKAAYGSTAKAYVAQKAA